MTISSYNLQIKEIVSCLWGIIVCAAWRCVVGYSVMCQSVGDVCEVT